MCVVNAVISFVVSFVWISDFRHNIFQFTKYLGNIYWMHYSTNKY